jgi:hypothetical protein
MGDTWRDVYPQGTKGTVTAVESNGGIYVRPDNKPGIVSFWGVQGQPRIPRIDVIEEAPVNSPDLDKVRQALWTVRQAAGKLQKEQPINAYLHIQTADKLLREFLADNT